MEPVRKDQLYSLLTKIRRLAEHPNTPKNEAAVAMMKFRNLLIKHGIQEAELSQALDTEEYQQLSILERSRIHPWQHTLAILIATFTGCVCVTSHIYRKKLRYEITFFGGYRDIVFAKQLYESLSSGFMTASKTEWKKVVARKWPEYHYKEHQYKREFLAGCVCGLDNKIRDIERETTVYADDKALMVQKRELIVNYLKSEKDMPSAKPVRLSCADSSAFMLGYLTGQKSNIDHALEENTNSLTNSTLSKNWE